MKNTKKSFTLVELLCAAALIVILAGIGFSAFSYASYRGKEAATKSLITRIAAGLETLKTKHGFYPSTSKKDGDKVTKHFTQIIVTMDNDGIISAIKFKKVKKESDPTAEIIAEIKDLKKVKDFLSVADAENIKKHLVSDSGTDYFLTDGWGGKIYYAYPGFFNTVKFDLLAPGADGAVGKNAVEINSEEDIPTNKNAYIDSNEWACDDITNFQ